MDGVSGERGRVAEIFKALAAIPAGSIHTADPGDADGSAAGQVGRAMVHDFADDLMAGNDFRVELGKFAFHNVQVGAADSTGEDAKQNVTFLHRRPRDFTDFEGPFGNLSR